MSKFIDVTMRLIDDFTSPLNNAVTKMQESARKTFRAGKEIESAGKSISKVGSTITKGVTVPIAGFAMASIKAGSDFESAFAGVKKTVDEMYDGQFDEIRQGILNMAKEIPASASAIAEVAENAGQLGIDADKIVDFSRVMIDLGESTNLSANDAASALAQYSNITGMAQTDFDKLGAVIVDLGNNFATTESDIVNMATRLAGAGSQVGLTDAEIMGFSTALTSVGIQAEMGGSAFSKAMINMQVACETGLDGVNELTKKTGKSMRSLQLMADNNSKDFKALAQSLGYTQTEMKAMLKAGQNLKDFADIAGMTSAEFKKAFEKDSAKAIQAFISGLGDVEGKGETTIKMLQDMGFTEVRLRDTLTRLASSGELVTKALDTGTNAWEENIALTNEAAQRYATFESQVNILKNKLTDISITVYTKLNPYLLQGIDIVNSIIDKLSDLSTEQQNVIMKTAGIAAAVGPSILVFGKVTEGIGATIESVGKLGFKMKDTSKRVKAAKDIMSAIAWPKLPKLNIPLPKSIIKSIGKIDALFKGIGGGALNTVKTVKNAADKFGSIVWNTKGLTSIRNVFSTIGNSKITKGILFPFKAIGKAIGGSIGGVGKLGKAFGGVGKALFTVLGPAGTTIVILAAIVAAGILIYKNWDKVKEMAGKTWNYVSQVIANSGIDVDALKEKALNLRDKFADTWVKIQGKLKAFWDWAEPIFKTIAGVFVAVLPHALAGVVSMFGSFFDSTMNIVGYIVDAFVGLGDFISNIFVGNWKDAWTGLKDFMGGIVKAMLELIKTPFNALISLINGAVNSINKIGITLPSWLPGEYAGKTFGFSLPTIPMLYTGTDDWKGGPAMVHDRGAEIIDLPQGTRVYPHDESLQMARQEGAASAGGNVTIAKIADTIVVREDADIDKIATALVDKLVKIKNNTGGVLIGDMA